MTTSIGAGAPPTRVLHVITGLRVGGAEAMLGKFLAAVEPRHAVASRVVSLLSGGAMAAALRASGVAVVELGWRASIGPSPAGVLRLLREVNDFQPHLVQGWMYHGNLAASLAGAALRERRFGWRRRAAVVWSIHNTLMDTRQARLPSAAITRAGAWLSRRRGMPDATFYVSERARREHVALGYLAARDCVIPIGFDCGRYKPLPTAAARLRHALGLPSNAALVGHVGRFHPMKGHARWIRAASELRRRWNAHADVRGRTLHFLLAGPQVTAGNSKLMGWIRATSSPEAFHLLGECHDMPNLLAGMDLLVQASPYGEAFPNVLGEAMACGTPCVATDVGDSARVIGDAGLVVAPGDDEALVQACLHALCAPDAQRADWSRRGRLRIEQHFGLVAMVDALVALYNEVLQRRAAACRVAS